MRWRKGKGWEEEARWRKGRRWEDKDGSMKG